MSLNTDNTRSTGKSTKNSPWMILGYGFVASIVLFAVGRMTWAVLGGSRLQYADYWRMVETLLLRDGSLSVTGLFNFSNHHFIAFAQFLYWLNIEFFSGSNIALGLIDVVIVCLTLVLLVRMVQQSNLHKALRLALICLSGTLLFGLSGAWNFVLAMSGAAWLSANLFVVAAIYQRSRDRHATTMAAAVLATMSYGTGLFVWPAIIAVGVIRRHYSQWWKEWPYIVGLVLSAAVVKLLTNNSGDTSTTDYLLVAQLAATFLGDSVGLSGAWSQAVGWVVLIGTPLCAAWLALFVRPQAESGWIGLAMYGWCALLVITQGRAIFMTIYGYQGRYYSIAALTWLGFSVLVILTLRSLQDLAGRPGKLGASGTQGAVYGSGGLGQVIAGYLLILPLTLGALITGESEVEKRDSRIYEQQLKEIALRLDVVDGSVGYLEGFTNNTRPFDSTRRLEIAGHYPFVEDWALDCGLLHTTLPASPAPRMGGKLRKVAPEKGLDSVTRISGIIPGEAIIEGNIRCVVVTDPRGLVIGVGALRPKSDDARQRFTALAYSSEAGYMVYFFDDGVGPVLLSGPDDGREGVKK